MNRKLTHLLKEIYASEQPEHIPKWLTEKQKEKNRKKIYFSAPVMAVFLLILVVGSGYMHLDEAEIQPAEQENINIPEAETETFVSTEQNILETDLQTETFPEEVQTETEIETMISTETEISETEPRAETFSETVQTETEIFTEPEMPETEPQAETFPETLPEVAECTGINISKMDERQNAYFALEYEVYQITGTENAAEQCDKIRQKAAEELNALAEESRNSIYYEQYENIEKELFQNHYGYPEGVYVNPVAQWSLMQAAYESFLEDLLDELEKNLSPDEIQQLQASHENFCQNLEILSFKENEEENNEVMEVFPWVLTEQFVEYRVLLLMQYFEK